jgi:hypothetical protein
LAIRVAEYSPCEDVFLVTLAVGLVVIAAISLSPLYAGRVRLPRGSAVLGAGLVASALGLAVAAALWQAAMVPSRNGAFLAAFVLLFLGALLIVRTDEGDDPGADADEPPWWPSFELDYRSYARRQRRVAHSSPRH